IYTLLRQNAEGRLYGITFVDNQNKVVFNGSDLGKGYSAAALQSRLATGSEKSLTQDETKGGSSGGSIQKEMVQQKQQEKTIPLTTKTVTPLDVLLSTREQYDNIPNSLLKKKRKKKKQNL
ncbi:MAG: relaxase/mobilization nuclease domain-containing protein, partial [Ferruginibacter sp.]